MDHCTPKWETSILKTSKSSRKSVSDIVHSFIASFRVDDDLDASLVTLDRTIYKVDLEDCSPKEKLNSATVLIDECASGRFPHLDFDFLQPDKIRDANGRLANDPEYCPRTLYVPDSFLKEQTPGHRQWWMIKSKYFDTILFFKVGKFYEMYHMDAVIGVENLNLTYMRGKIAHCGFPEIGYGRFADQLISRGFKVARIEQTETPTQLEERNKVEKIHDKVVRREVCSVTTAGTRTYGVLDSSDDRSALDAVESAARYLLAFAEKINEAGITIYGVCFIDTSVGKFYLSQFEDDSNRSSLRTLFAHYQPSQILYERGRLSNATNNLLQCVASGIVKEALIPKKEFLTAEFTIKRLKNKSYFGDEVHNWPEVVKKLIDDANTVSPICSSDYIECMMSFGAVLWYLERCLIDVDMITMRNFEWYIPPAYIYQKTAQDGAEHIWRDRHLILDGISLSNLNIIPPMNGLRRVVRDSISSKYSLYNTVNKCSTPFGKRLLRQWLCSPSCDSSIISARQNAIQWMLDAERKEFMIKATDHLRKLPDFERLLQKIHTMGLKYRASEHPDGRAVLFEATRYNRRKINDLLITLSGFDRVLALVEEYRNLPSGKSELLQRCFGDQFPDISADLKHFKKGFNHEKAREEGVIIPERGVIEEYDAIIDDINDCIVQLDSYLENVRRNLKCSNINYTGSGRSRYQIEIPESIAKNLGSDFELKSSRKGYKRMTTSESTELFQTLIEAEERKDLIQRDVMRRVFADFDSRSSKWAAVTERIAIFDVLLSLARYAQTSGLIMCRPEFDYDSQKPLLDITSGYHPSLAIKPFSNNDSDFAFIPNSVKLGAKNPSTLLLTGPNMGGKSTLMRQVACLVVLAQIGSFVPAKKMCLSPVDRIFTRIGANDRIAAGQSTFYVELNETNIILRNATEHSLVIMDELGRGTSTHDGTAIAYAVLKDLALRINCRALFSTHYHSLCTAVEHISNIKTAHMACVVENENDSDPTMENVTFLYTLADGVCSKSHGFYAAKVSGIKQEIIRTAFAASHKIDSSTVRRRFALSALYSAAMSGQNVELLSKMVSEL